MEKQEKAKEKDELKEAQEKIVDLTETLQRVQADFENYKKLVEKRIKEIEEFASRNLIVKLLPILDSFEMAIKNQENKEEFAKGAILIHNQICSVLEREGLQPIDCKGRIFDPYKHEVLLKEANDLPENTVVDELQKGYMLKKMVVRPSKVKVSSGIKEVKKCK